MTLTLRYAARSDRGLIRTATRTPSTPGRGCSPSPTAWAAWPPVTSPATSSSARMAPLDEDVPGDALVDALRTAVEAANQQLRDTVDANPRHGGHGHHADRACCSPAARSAWCTSATRAPTCCATASSPRSPRTTRTSRCWSTRAGSAPEEAEQPPAAVAAHPGAGRPRRRPGVLGAPGARRRPLPALQRRPVRRGQRRDHRRDAARVRRPAASAPSGWSQLALRGGGPDNITVIVADVTDAGHRRGRPRSSAARPPATAGMATSADDSTAGGPGLGAAPQPRAAAPSRRRPGRRATTSRAPAGTRCARR